MEGPFFYCRRGGCYSDREHCDSGAGWRSKKMAGEGYRIDVDPAGIPRVVKNNADIFKWKPVNKLNGFRLKIDFAA